MRAGIGQLLISHRRRPNHRGPDNRYSRHLALPLGDNIKLKQSSFIACSLILQGTEVLYLIEMKEGNEIWPVAISHKTDGVGEQWPQAVPHKSVYLSLFQKESQGIQPNLG